MPEGCKDKNDTPRLKFWSTEEVNERWAYVSENLKNVKLKKLEQSPVKMEVVEPPVICGKQMKELADMMVESLMQKLGTERGMDLLMDAMTKRKERMAAEDKNDEDKKEEEKKEGDEEMEEEEQEEKEEEQEEKEEDEKMKGKRGSRKRARTEEDQEVTSPTKPIMVSSGTNKETEV